MIYKQNLHIHTTFCDGKDTPEETVLTAIQKGYDSIGFSEHSYMYYSRDHHINLEDLPKYKACVNELKHKYADKIKIFCGLEYDIYSDIDMSGYDYLIGSVHFLDVNGEKIPFERPVPEVRQMIDTYFGGDPMKYVEKYYETLASLYKYGNFDIIGHLDLITKHREKTVLFDENSKQYRDCVLTALESLSGKIPLFELNSGAIARGHRITPFPCDYLLPELKRLGFGAVITSDCHDRRYLDCYYKESLELLRQNGFKEIYILTDSGFKPVSI